MKIIKPKLFIAGLVCFFLNSCTEYDVQIVGDWRLLATYGEDWGYYIPSTVLILTEFDGTHCQEWTILLDTATFAPTDTVFYETAPYECCGKNIFVNGVLKWEVDNLNDSMLFLKKDDAIYCYKSYP